MYLVSLRRLTILCGAVFVLVLLFMVHLHREKDVLQIEAYLRVSLNSHGDFPGFVVDTPGCKIPDVDPFDKSIHHLIVKTSVLNCNATPPLTYSDGDFLRINRTALRAHYADELDRCEFQVIYRPKKNSDNIYEYNKTVISITSDAKVHGEFIRIACYGIGGELIYQNFHAFVLTKPELEKRCDQAHSQHWQKQKVKDEIFNVVMIGLDSVSRLNFVRQMPRTRRYLVRKLKAVELKGYNKVADNTYVNLVPMFAGKFVEELPWNESMSSVPFDKYNFLWKNFSSLGYRTFFAEDAPTVAIFNYAKSGFHKPPMDYYLRPFSLAMEDHGSVWNTNHDCVGTKLETEVVLDHMHDFLTKFRNKPHFAFSFLTRLTHDNINKLGHADEPYYDFIRKLDEAKHFENTVFFFFSDHGIRFGPIRETYIGKLEERLPFMILVLPPRLRQRYPEMCSNLKINAHKLTTPFDIYATLVDILNFKGKGPKYSSPVRSMSLFSEIPGERTCEHAAILPHWCTCHEQMSISVDDASVMTAVDVTLENIHYELQQYHHLCARLSIDAILDARVMTANENVLRFRQSLHDVIGRKVKYGSVSDANVNYLVTFRTSPGGGLFEATVRHSLENDKFQVVGEISRINRFGHQSQCVDMQRLEKFCYCV